MENQRVFDKANKNKDICNMLDSITKESKPTDVRKLSSVFKEGIKNELIPTIQKIFKEEKENIISKLQKREFEDNQIFETEVGFYE